MRLNFTAFPRAIPLRFTCEGDGLSLPLPIASRSRAVSKKLKEGKNHPIGMGAEAEPLRGGAPQCLPHCFENSRLTRCSPRKALSA